MAVEHLRSTITKKNLWLYILHVLREGPASPSQIERIVGSNFGFSPARITFYSVLYKLRREGLVERTTDSFRSKYRITPRGERAMEEGIGMLSSTIGRLRTQGGQRSATEAL